MKDDYLVKVVFVQEQFKARVLWLLFWQEGKVKNTPRKKKKKSKNQNDNNKKNKAGFVHFCLLYVWILVFYMCFWPASFHSLLS